MAIIIKSPFYGFDFNKLSALEGVRGGLILGFPGNVQQANSNEQYWKHANSSGHTSINHGL